MFKFLPPIVQCLKLTTQPLDPKVLRSIQILPKMLQLHKQVATLKFKKFLILVRDIP